MLSKLVLKNVKSFSSLELRFNAAREGGDGWTVLVGVNGTGKSTILQSLVVGLMDPRPVTNLVPAPWRFVRAEQAAGEIAVSIGSVETKRSVQVADGSYFVDEGDPVAVPLLLGLSARRRFAKQGELFEPENAELSRVEGLFKSDHGLLTQDPFAALDTKAERRDFAKVIANVLTHELADGTRMFPLVDSYELRGRGGVQRSELLVTSRRFVLRYGDEFQVRVAVEELSDGYQAVLALVLEILSQAALHSGSVPDPESLEAIVLVDEIEAHLHPQWQRSIIPLLRSVFPRCQFVVTTHSPLVVASARDGEVVALDIGTAGDVQPVVLDDLPQFDANRLYDEVFGVTRAGDPVVVDQERRYLAARAQGKDVDPELAAVVREAWAGPAES